MKQTKASRTKKPIMVTKREMLKLAREDAELRVDGERNHIAVLLLKQYIPPTGMLGTKMLAVTVLFDADIHRRANTHMKTINRMTRKQTAQFETEVYRRIEKMAPKDIAAARLMKEHQDAQKRRREQRFAQLDQRLDQLESAAPVEPHK